MNVRSESWESTNGFKSQSTSEPITRPSDPSPPFLAWVNIPGVQSNIDSEFEDIDKVVAAHERNEQRREYIENARRQVAERFPQETIGIAALRMRLGWSQQRLADEIGTSQPHIARIEAGRDILLDTARRLASALQVTLLDIDAAVRATRPK
jgi:ribosome-binding protein aMBF1 (putative translation factor)